MKKQAIGPLMLDVAGTTLTAEEKEILAHPTVGGVILFTRNFESVPQIQALNKALKQAGGEQLLIAVDHEGGRVQRFREGFSAIPAMGSLAEMANGDESRLAELVETMGWLMAAEVHGMGADFSFAPVLDVHGVSDVIGDRAFAASPDDVTRLASYFIRGMSRAGMAATGKHFPGHGSVKEDSHIAMPVDNRSIDEITQLDLRVFNDVIAAGLLKGIMPAHVIYPAADAQPACFSPYWLQTVLREQLGFDGAIFSDDLSMKGAECIGSFTDRADAALAAGCDMVLVCNTPDEAVKVLDHLPIHDNASRTQRLARFLAPSAPDMKNLQTMSSWQQANALLQSVRQA